MKRVALLIITCAVASMSCVSMDRIPSASEIRNWPALEPFLVEAASVTGVYQNVDIDSVVFYYSTTLTAENVFWCILNQRAVLAGWRHIDGVGSTYEVRKYETFQRLKPRGELGFSSAEELRVAYSPARVVVAYVQSDQNGDPKPVSQVSEGRFADQEIWPRFKELVAGSGAG